MICMLSQYRRLVKNISDDCKKSPASLLATYTLFYAIRLLLYSQKTACSIEMLHAEAHLRQSREKPPLASLAALSNAPSSPSSVST